MPGALLWGRFSTTLGTCVTREFSQHLQARPYFTKGFFGWVWEFLKVLFPRSHNIYVSGSAPQPTRWAMPSFPMLSHCTACQNVFKCCQKSSSMALSHSWVFQNHNLFGSPMSICCRRPLGQPSLGSFLLQPDSLPHHWCPPTGPQIGAMRGIDDLIIILPDSFFAIFNQMFKTWH